MKNRSALKAGNALDINKKLREIRSEEDLTTCLLSYLKELT